MKQSRRTAELTEKRKHLETQIIIRKYNQKSPKTQKSVAEKKNIPCEFIPSSLSPAVSLKPLRSFALCCSLSLWFKGFDQMGTPFHIPVTAAQVGTYFVGQYYQVLQQQPDFVHQFYSDASTMLRVDGHFRESATAMLQIHALVMSLSYTGVEIKTAHSLESWNGGVLVMVSGSVQMKNFNQMRKFVQTFFLAPQEKGYFVLNDIFHFVDEEPVHHYPAVLLSQSNLDSTLNAPTTAPETVPNYSLNGAVQAPREFATPVVKENGHVDNRKFVEQQLQQVPEPKSIIEESTADVNSIHQNAPTVSPDPSPVSVEEHAEEPQKQTYASILRVAKGQEAPASIAASQYPVSKSTPSASEKNYTPPSTAQQLTTALQNNSEREQTGGEFPSVDDEGEIKSVYVRNLPSTVSASEVEEEFKHFGKLSSDGVVIRSRKDVGFCYAFVEFEDVTGVQNAIKAGTAQVAGRQVYIEERRANSNVPHQGGRRGGRGRGSYHTESSRGHHSSSRSYNTGVRDGSDREYIRPRGNGFYRPTTRQDKVNHSHQISRNGESPSESS
ncbi:putative G3BP-like protein isoform X1 [Cucurbita pepo subsp. pepo]|uniref:putative G3BP-like protein isoform X1 n=2 Tax=Cucurbita pepo subsp. pepo TaxID=3664 RepID=UPI000C9D4DA9|nr:putative G3BP-like protein isoform X1 [Cucurbita pepo subsp. pepo]